MLSAGWKEVPLAGQQEIGVDGAPGVADQGVPPTASTDPQSTALATTAVHAAAPHRKDIGAPFDELTLEEVRLRQERFSKERDWDQFHTPRNLALALVGEVGELCEIFQWKGEVAAGLPGWPEDELVHLEEELSDVLIYLLRLSDRCGIDLAKAVVSKLEKNARKYPVEKVKGSSKKYTHYASDRS